MKKANTMIAMSGGVDSAVAAYLTAQGADAAGVTMRLFDAEGKDERGAAAVCKAIGIPHFVADLTAEFQSHVIAPFIEAYEAGLTPNPCIFCNRALKFGALLDFARSKSYEAIATGHYARVERDANGRYLLRRAVAAQKDQSYMLYTLSQEVLSRVSFPLGELEKGEVRDIAASLGFPMAQQKDSQDICFVPDGDYAAFIERATGRSPAPGRFISPAGDDLGEHRGMLRYTVGQRKGLGIALGKPAYVLSKSASDNTVTVDTDEQLLFTTRVVAQNINLIPFDRLESPRRFLAKIRYRQEATPALVEQTDADTLTVEFEHPQRAVSPGQSLVLYEDDYVVGGGIIV